ncbi:type II toxin-antitoxin system VapC family toxin [Brevundimonas subvibrioides]|uniref:type II toxin-antitoxin system VapC family toxin n=1 Tax=Brevundimonas subvibrioides TaxID=74313 RepID=UPI0022B2AE5E|nr:type II toxin-antitoxin system VapC family toxin [Brevundimonas subvibrioides]
MTITIDTNVLVRLIVGDDADQTRSARTEVLAAERVVVTLVALCEAVWVLKSRYGFGRAEIGSAIGVFLSIPSVIVDRPTVEHGLAHLNEGGDFTDAIIAAEGLALGSQSFVSFDRKAIRRLTQSGLAARLPGALAK